MTPRISEPNIRSHSHGGFRIHPAQALEFSVLAGFRAPVADRIPTEAGPGSAPVSTESSAVCSLTPHGRRRTAVPYSFPVADRSPEWLAHAAPIMVCVCHGIGKATHHWPTGMCSDGWLAARQRGEV